MTTSFEASHYSLAPTQQLFLLWRMGEWYIGGDGERDYGYDYEYAFDL
jgi:hypothetical protein